MAQATGSHGDPRTSLNGHGIFAIIVFAVVALICIQPIYIPVPHPIARKARALKVWLVGPSLSGEQREAGQGHGEDLQPPTATGARPQAPVEDEKRVHLVLNHVWTPAIGILFLLATTTIGGEQIKVGIVGEEDVEPYDVLIFFISLAYIAISLDATGLLRYLAFQVCLKAGNSGMGLYLVLYAFFWTLGVLVGNDPVILSGTAFLVYLTRVAGISPPSAWIWGQFVAANISSAVLVSSNPTNLVIASGFNISFPIYTAYMVLPSLVSAAVALLAILIFFRNKTKPAAVKPTSKGSLEGVRGWTKSIFKGTDEPAGMVRHRSRQHEPADGQDIALGTMNANGQQQQDDHAEEVRHSPTIYIPKTIVRPDVDARAALVDPKGAIFASVVMAVTLITVIITNVTGGAKVYMIAAPGAGICLVRDIVYDWYTWRSFRKKEQSQSRDTIETQQGQRPQDFPPTATGKTSPTAEVDTGRDGTDKTASVDQFHQLQSSNSATKPPVLDPLLSAARHLTDIFPTVSYVMARLPFPLLPFAFGMFILVQSLAHVGFINIMAGGLGNVCGHGYVGCSFFISTLGVILCNVR